ncbi:MAG: hypothetical protein RL701_8020, partial [Pseudomonadota bacterium]
MTEYNHAARGQSGGSLTPAEAVAALTRRTFDLNKPLDAQWRLEVVEYMAQLWTGWAFALVLGVRHASEPDHL